MNVRRSNNEGYALLASVLMIMLGVLCYLKSIGG